MHAAYFDWYFSLPLSHSQLRQKFQSLMDPSLQILSTQVRFAIYPAACENNACWSEASYMYKDISRLNFLSTTLAKLSAKVQFTSTLLPWGFAWTVWVWAPNGLLQYFEDALLIGYCVSSIDLVWGHAWGGTGFNPLCTQSFMLLHGNICVEQMDRLWCEVRLLCILSLMPDVLQLSKGDVCRYKGRYVLCSGVVWIQLVTCDM